MAQINKIEYFIKKPEKGLHSETHALAKEISEYCCEPKKFGMYLGVIKNIGLPRAYQIFAEMRQAKEIKTPGKLFLYLSAYKKPGLEKIKKNKKASPNPEATHKIVYKNPRKSSAKRVIKNKWSATRK